MMETNTKETIADQDAEAYVDDLNSKIRQLQEKLERYEFIASSKNTLMGNNLEWVIKDGIPGLLQDDLIPGDEKTLIEQDKEIIEKYKANFGLDNSSFSVLMELQSKEVLRLICVCADISTHLIEK